MCKISGSKIWSCKIFDKYHLCWAKASREIAWHLMCFGKGGNFWHFLSFCRNFRHFSQKFLSFCHFPSFSEKTCLAKKVPGIPDAWIQLLLSPGWAEHVQKAWFGGAAPYGETRPVIRPGLESANLIGRNHSRLWRNTTSSIKTHVLLYSCLQTKSMTESQNNLGTYQSSVYNSVSRYILYQLLSLVQ